ncbi:P-loop NTPase fold protein [Thomasclavelia spiroformis]|uniref:KAP family P-loop NTPase fold protein n=1 Tax=Thomasclavelia spiroformis TaxID=29348 RepID=UPI00399F1C9E
MKEFDYSDENIVKTINKNYFQRIKLLKRIIKKLSDDSSDIKSICINAPWGTGKTVFVHELKYLINNSQDLSNLNTKLDLSEIKVAKDIGCYYFNSWENDSINLPTLSLLYNILQDETWASADFINKIDNLKLNAANLLVRILSRGSLGINDFKVDNSSIFDEIFSSNKIKEEFNKTIDEYLKINGLKKLIIIVDELDRCRPDYAVNMLESIKHFFNNEKLIFIISTDLIQLSHTIKKFYGYGYDSNLYLQRFFDRIITLDNINLLKEYIYSELDIDFDKILIFNNIIKHCIDYLDMSTREINKFIATFRRIYPPLLKIFNYKEDEIYFKELRKTAYFDAFVGAQLFVIYAIALKIKNTTKFLRYINGKLHFDIEKFIPMNSQIMKTLNAVRVSEDEMIYISLYQMYFDLFLRTDSNFRYFSKKKVYQIRSLIKYEI